MSSVSAAKIDRKTLRTRSTKLVNKLTPAYLDGLDINELNTNQFKIQKFLDSLFDLDKILNDELKNTNADEEVFLDSDELCQDYEDKLRNCYSAVVNKIKDISDRTQSNISQPIGSVHVPNRAKLMLPNLILPKFYADPLKDEHTCQTFVDTLEHLLSSYNLNDAEKYGMLEQQTFGRAKAMIQSLTLANRSYVTARTILLQSFAEEIPQKFATIKKFNSLKLKSDGDPYLFFAEFSKLIETAKEQKIDSDTFIQYCIWEALPVGMQDTIINVSQSSYPKLNEIRDHFLVASGRFEAQKSKKVSNQPVVSTHATHLKLDSSPYIKYKNVNKQGRVKLYCCFCESNEHSSAKCTRYGSVKIRKDRLIELQLCSKCLKSGHCSKSCNFKVSGKCHKCSRMHWSFLCDEKLTHRAIPALAASNENSTAVNVVTNTSD